MRVLCRLFASWTLETLGIRKPQEFRKPWSLETTGIWKPLELETGGIWKPMEQWSRANLKGGRWWAPAGAFNESARPRSLRRGHGACWIHISIQISDSQFLIINSPPSISPPALRIPPGTPKACLKSPPEAPLKIFNFCSRSLVILLF